MSVDDSLSSLQRHRETSTLTVAEHPFACELRELGVTPDQLAGLHFARHEGPQVTEWPIEFPNGFPVVPEELVRQYLTLRWLEIDQLSVLQAREQARSYIEAREVPYFQGQGRPHARGDEAPASGWRNRRNSVRDGAISAMRKAHEKGQSLQQWLELAASRTSELVRVINHKHVTGYAISLGDDATQWITRSQLKVWWTQAEANGEGEAPRGRRARRPGRRRTAAQ